MKHFIKIPQYDGDDVEDMYRKFIDAALIEFFLRYDSVDCRTSIIGTILKNKDYGAENIAGFDIVVCHDGRVQMLVLTHGGTLSDAEEIFV